MLTPDTRLRPNASEVAAKVMDGEAILINLSNGMYYNMEQVGGVIWESIEAGHSLREIVSAVTERYEVASERALADVERVAGELLREKLVIVSADASPSAAAVNGAPVARLPYVLPRLNKYGDMADLLALDPPMPGLPDIPWEGSAR
jgi:hypothetical protein